jgi:hypothetical protein
MQSRRAALFELELVHDVKPQPRYRANCRATVHFSPPGDTAPED